MLVHLLQCPPAQPAASHQCSQIREIRGRPCRQITPPGSLVRPEADRERHRIGSHLCDVPLPQAQITVEPVGSTLLAPPVDLGDERQLQRVGHPAHCFCRSQARLELGVVHGGGPAHRALACTGDHSRDRLQQGLDDPSARGLR